MKVKCRTNLDLHREEWPTEMLAIPSVGDFIVSAAIWDNDFQLRLEVVSITWKRMLTFSCGNSHAWQPIIELHIPRHYSFTITKFYDWYAPKVGRTVSSFI